MKNIKAHRKKIFLAIGATLLIFSLILLLRYMNVATSEPQGPKIGEIVERNRQTYTKFLGKSEDGKSKYAATSNLSPINYLDKMGKWHEYDFTLVKSQQQDFAYQLASSDYQTYFKDTLITSPAVKIERDGKYIHMHPQNLMYINGNGQQEEIARVNPIATAIVENNKITYKNVYGRGLDLMFTVSAGVATITAGETIRIVKNPHVTQNSLIYVTPVSDVYGETPFILKQQNNTSSDSASFTVKINNTVQEDIKFNFLIIN